MVMTREMTTSRTASEIIDLDRRQCFDAVSHGHRVGGTERHHVGERHVQVVG